MDRRRLDGGVHALVSGALEDRGVLAAFTERTGGTSEPPFESLNVGARTDDDPDHVLQNRRRVAAALGLDSFATLRQVHGAGLVRLGERRAGAGFGSPDGSSIEADAAVVTRPGLAVAILTADCVPVALALRDGLVVIHAGWRGLAAGIVERVLDAVDRPVAAAIGPAIGPCHYEVGQDVALAVAAGSDAGAKVERRSGRVFLDLPATVARLLRKAGVRAIDRAEECTACEPERFFSHRLEGTTGRQALVAMRLP